MNKLQQLIQELCPNGVEYKTLGECSFMKRGTSATKSTLKLGNIPVISGGKEPAFYCSISNRDGETITVAGSGAGAGFVQFWNTPIFVNDAFSVKGKENIDTKYLYYYLQNIQERINATKKGGGVPHVHISSIENFLVPVPPLAVQSEIVQILDKFTTLTAELQAELQARKSQYDYYRNQLLDYPMEESDQPSLLSSRSATSIKNNDNLSQQSSASNPPTNNSVSQQRGKVEWKKLNDVVEIHRGKRLVKRQLENVGKYAVYQNCMIPLGYHNESNVEADTTFIICAGSAGEICYSDIAFWAADDVYYFIPNNEIKSRFLYYFLLSKQHVISSQVRHSSVPRLSRTAFEKLLIPIPPLAEQERIVAILDKFDTIVNSISEGLPKEIELRQKQYEYYRNLLLTFPQKNA